MNAGNTSISHVSITAGILGKRRGFRNTIAWFFFLPPYPHLILSSDLCDSLGRFVCYSRHHSFVSEDDPLPGTKCLFTIPGAQREKRQLWPPSISSSCEGFSERRPCVLTSFCPALVRGWFAWGFSTPCLWFLVRFSCICYDLVCTRI